MKDDQKYELCALCNRPINTSNKVIKGVGKVGPECYDKYIGLEGYLKQLSGNYFNYASALKHIGILKCSWHSG